MLIHVIVAVTSKAQLRCYRMLGRWGLRTGTGGALAVETGSTVLTHRDKGGRDMGGWCLECSACTHTSLVYRDVCCMSSQTYNYNNGVSYGVVSVGMISASIQFNILACNLFPLALTSDVHGRQLGPGTEVKCCYRVNLCLSTLHALHMEPALSGKREGWSWRKQG